MTSLQRFEGFYWVARCEGYARAARAFPYPITQPGVHQQVRRLEEELGVRLFERVGKDRVVLTAQGRTLYAHVAPFLEALPGLAAQLRGGQVGGTLRIHASGHVLRHLLPAWLRRLQQRRADIEVALFEAKVPAVAQVLGGEADVLVDHLPELPGGLEARVVAHTRAFLVLPAHHRLARRAQLSPAQLLAQLNDEPFIAYSADAHLRGVQLAALAAHGVTPRRVHAADSSDTILGFVAAGLGYSLLASLLPKGPQLPGVVARPLEGAAPRYPVHAAWRRGAAPHPLVEALLALAPPIAPPAAR
ncbi:LysR family transcriptional regulator [Aggregicoccus sp. 17bor-14]|uniref:LysR family transcriptional regulator n=1 Tax=Myxococcaceae TaxID=31 RepID=UPI00129C9DC7|nr:MULTISPECIES: LysR family transcriptional regulator [Myxococcaceae]MBF5044551.1 LysR family transcriptional regulator [Simulacricoccus sp. 17bor-14]MRI90296.1 LysR family transcriptional regulator [Aggregicoccus sp. 17bor-14]